MRTALLTLTLLMGAVGAYVLAQPLNPTNRPGEFTAPKSQLPDSFNFPRQPGSSKIPTGTESASPAKLSPVDSSIRFDPKLAELKQTQGRWTLVAGNLWVKDYGPNEKEAHNALELIRALQIRELATIGQSRPALEYMVATAPPGRLRGMNLKWYSFRPDRVELRSSFNEWQLVENTQPLLKFGSNKTDAERTLALIRTSHFTQMGMPAEPRQPPLVVFYASPHAGPGEPTANQPQTPTNERQPIIRTNGSMTSPETKIVDATSRTPFDFRQAQLRKEKESWKIKVGSATVKDCGPDETDARKALRAIQFFKFNEQHVLGSGDYLFEYFLKNGQPPRGERVLGLEGQSFNPDALLLRYLDGNWWIVENNRQFLRFESQDRAALSLEIIKRYHFDEVVRIGRPKPFMMFFTTRRQNSGGSF